MNLCDLTAGNISDVVLVWKKKKNQTWCICSQFEVFCLCHSNLHNLFLDQTVLTIDSYKHVWNKLAHKHFILIP